MVTRIRLADDHTMFREGLQSILASREGVEVVVGSSSTGPEVAEQVRRTKPDVIVTQPDMQPKSAQEIIEGCAATPTCSWCVARTGPPSPRPTLGARTRSRWRRPSGRTPTDPVLRSPGARPHPRGPSAGLEGGDDRVAAQSVSTTIGAVSSRVDQAERSQSLPDVAGLSNSEARQSM